jgi:hypothetical protein
MLPDWNTLSDEMQIALGREALKRAADAIAGQAESLAGEFENGSLIDRGGPDALRLLAALVRASGRDPWVTAGNA